MLPGEAGINVRKTARYAGKYCDPLHLRLKEGAAPKSINEEVGFLLRLLNERGDAIRYKMRRGKTLRLRYRRASGKRTTRRKRQHCSGLPTLGRPSPQRAPCTNSLAPDLRLSNQL